MMFAEYGARVGARCFRRCTGVRTAFIVRRCTVAPLLAVHAGARSVHAGAPVGARPVHAAHQW